jgi:UDP-N-acetylglucosamine 2-epimerase (non-hydrolysing)
LKSFDLAPEIELDVMRPGQRLGELTARCLTAVTPVIHKLRPALVVVQGDTASALAGALAAFYEQVPVAHVEAGLRTGNHAAPFPEEANRQVISRLATLHFAPTLDAKSHLLNEGIDAASIEVTGNTIVDALALLAPHIQSSSLSFTVPTDQRLVLVTAHRRENLGRPLRSICAAIRQLASTRPQLCFVCITHPNPLAARIAHQQLAGRERVILSPPLSYIQLLSLLNAAWVVLTDSGGLQEEAPTFGKPVLVLRDHTERVEGLSLGYAKLIGTEKARVISELSHLLDCREAYDKLTPDHNPYGDGAAAERIVRSLARFVGVRKCRIAA